MKSLKWMVNGGEWMLTIVPNGGAKPKNSMKPYQATVSAISSHIIR